jgi:hypothetical protein
VVETLPSKHEAVQTPILLKKKKKPSQKIKIKTFLYGEDSATSPLLLPPNPGII